MDECLRFVAKLLDGEKMAVMCREFGISRKTRYKIFNRYKDFGIRGLEDQARSPYRHPNKTPFKVEKAILRIKRERMTSGAPKIRDKLIKVHPAIKPLAPGTIHAILDKHGLVKRRKRRRHKAKGAHLSCAQSSNASWCADYKGQFLLGNKQYCYLLTITDNRLVADALEADWNEQLRRLDGLQQDNERQRETDENLLAEDARIQIMALAKDFPRVWQDPCTEAIERKRMVALLVEDVTLRKGDEIAVDVHVESCAINFRYRWCFGSRKFTLKYVSDDYRETD